MNPETKKPQRDILKTLRWGLEIITKVIISMTNLRQSAHQRNHFDLPLFHYAATQNEAIGPAYAVRWVAKHCHIESHAHAALVAEQLGLSGRES